MTQRDLLFIDGQWQASQNTAAIEVVNPSTEEVFARVPAGCPVDVELAVAAARAALPAWSETPAARRAEYLERIAQGLQERSEELAAVITAELGMPLKLSRRIQVGLPILTLQQFAGLARDYVFEEPLGASLIVREPVGVVACITPWNYPLHQIAAKVAAALAAGCTVVVKPSEMAPLDAFILAEVVAAVGLPAGVFNLVSGPGHPVGEALAGHPGVDMVSFTGSTRAGRRIMELAASSIKRTALELGGKSPSVILEDADLAAAVKGTVSGCFLNSGQTCSALTRMLVPESRYQEAAALAVEAAQTYTVGDPMAGQTRLGPLVSAVQRERVRDYIRRGIAEGAELLLGGETPPPGLERGYYVQPTVFGRVTGEMSIARDEIFGPVLAILPYRDEAHALALANDSDYGLAAAVWSGDEAKGLRMARRLRAGQVDVNGAAFNPLAPFGGFKQSGYGREMGRFGLEEFLEVKSVQRPG